MSGLARGCGMLRAGQQATDLVGDQPWRIEDMPMGCLASAGLAEGAPHRCCWGWYLVLHFATACKVRCAGGPLPATAAATLP